MVGFIVDTSLFELGFALGFPAFAARIFSMAIAIFTAFMLHRKITFRHTDEKFWPLYWRYLSTNLIGAAFNYTAFYAVLLALDNTLASRLMAIAIGTLVGLAFNYWASAKFVFYKRKPSDE